MELPENYYVPLSVGISDTSRFFIVWRDDNYRIINECPLRDIGTENAYIYHEISPWGYTRDVGNTTILNTAPVILGTGCTQLDTDIGQVSITSSLFDAPNFAPYWPIYTILAFAVCIFMIKLALHMVLGNGRNR